MICQCCNKKEARFEIVEIKENKRKSIFVCQDCRDKYQSNEFDNNFNLEKQKNVSISKTLKCPNCNQTLEDFFRTKELGCEMCFNQFKEYIDHIADNYKHIGKAPIKKTVQLDDRLTLTQIQSKLKSAILREDFQAAKELKELRDKLLNKDE